MDNASSTDESEQEHETKKDKVNKIVDAPEGEELPANENLLTRMTTTIERENKKKDAKVLD